MQGEANSSKKPSVEGRLRLEPHEVKHLLGRRLFCFFDEWMSYGVMLYLYNYNPELFWVMLGPAIYMNYQGYAGLWQLRKKYDIEEDTLPKISGLVSGFTSCLLDDLPAMP